jgi:hypothetical protein
MVPTSRGGIGVEAGTCSLGKSGSRRSRSSLPPPSSCRRRSCVPHLVGRGQHQRLPTGDAPDDGQQSHRPPAHGASKVVIARAHSGSVLLKREATVSTRHWLEMIAGRMRGARLGGGGMSLSARPEGFNPRPGPSASDHPSIGDRMTGPKAPSRPHASVRLLSRPLPRRAYRPPRREHGFPVSSAGP